MSIVNFGRKNNNIVIDYDACDYEPILIWKKYKFVVIMALIFLAVSLLDLSTTVYARAVLDMREKNPIFNQSIAIFIPLKIACSSAMAAVIIKNISKILAWWAVIATLGVVIWNIYKIVSLWIQYFEIVG